MKKKILSMLVAVVAISASAAFVINGSWRVIKDSGCNRCVITNNTRKCGQCGGFLNIGRLEPSDSYRWEAKFTCSSCRHQVRGASN